MYLQCVEILAKFRIAKFGIRALQIQNRNEKRREKVWTSPSKITGEKESGNTIWIFHWRSLCVRAHVYVHVCVRAHVCVHVYVHVCVCTCVCAARLQELCLHGSQCLLSVQASWLCQVRVTA